MRIKLLTLAFTLTANTVLAAPGCEAIAHKFVDEIGATIERRDPVYGNFFLRHPAATEFTVSCGPLPRPLIEISLDGAPTADYLRLGIIAARFISETEDAKLGATIAACLKLARKSKDEMAETTSPHVRFECQSFVRDGGGNSVTVTGR